MSPRISTRKTTASLTWLAAKQTHRSVQKMIKAAIQHVVDDVFDDDRS